MNRARTTIGFIALALLLPLQSFAAPTIEISTVPVVIDEKAKPRDIIKQSVTISNRSEHKVELYPTVNDIHSLEGQQEFVSALDATDREASLANWIEISRGVIELGAGEIKTIPFTIRVTANAKPATYHAELSFAHGSNRDEAVKVASVTVNLEVKADIKEILQLNKFSTDSIFFAGDDVLFNYQVENIGNQALAPKGEIRIYNRKGEEVAAIDVNKEGKNVTPDQLSQMASVWSAATGFGKYKAFLNLEYGSSQTASVQDTVFFWVIPWQQLLGLFVISIAALIYLGFRFERYFHERNMVHAGVVPVMAPTPALPITEPAVAVTTPLPTPLVQKSWKERLAGVISHVAPEGVPVQSTPVVDEKMPASVVAPAPQQTTPSVAQHTIDLKGSFAKPVQTKPLQTGSGVINLKKV